MSKRKVAGLRQSVLRSQKSRKKGKGGWRGNWRDRFDIPKAEGASILLTRGDYDDPEYIDDETGEMGASHFHTCQVHSVRLAKGGKGSFYTSRCAIDHAIANGGTEDDADCLHCLQQEQGDRRVGTKSTYSFNVVHLALYEKVHAERDGKKLFYERDGEKHKRGDPIMNWQEVTRPKARKRILADIDELVEDDEVRMFAKRYLEVGAGFREQISSLSDEAGKFCKCGGDLTPTAFECEECEEIICDVEEEDLDATEVAEFQSQRQRCEHCGHSGFPVADPVCDSCDEPEALTAFDVVAKIRKRGEGTNTTILFDEVVPLTDFELPNGATLLEWDDDDPEEDEDGNWVFTEDYDFRKVATSQFNFEKVHEPSDNDWVASRLKCNNPFKRRGGGGASKYHNYGGRKDEEEDEDTGDEESEAPRRGSGRTSGRRRRRRSSR